MHGTKQFQVRNIFAATLFTGALITLPVAEVTIYYEKRLEENTAAMEEEGKQDATFETNKETVDDDNSDGREQQTE